MVLKTHTSQRPVQAAPLGRELRSVRVDSIHPEPPRPHMSADFYYKPEWKSMGRDTFGGPSACHITHQSVGRGYLGPVSATVARAPPAATGRRD